VQFYGFGNASRDRDFRQLSRYQSLAKDRESSYEDLLGDFLRAAFRPAGNECGLKALSFASTLAKELGARTFRKLRWVMRAITGVDELASGAREILTGS